MQILYQVDAFTNTLFSGNPAAVCVLDAPADEAWMQNLAREMNLSETAFLVPRTDEGHFDLRWFTPAVEVDLCGHATLASAHVLWETGYVLASTPLTFHTRSGPLYTRRHHKRIAMDFPAKPPVPAEAPAGLVEALGEQPVYVGSNKMDYLVQLASADAVRTLTPDLSLLARVEARGVMVTAVSDVPGYDFISRFFAPRAGVPEDPVTGSAHCALGPFWKEQLGKDDLVGYQASARGGMVGVQVNGDRVTLFGEAVTVLKAELQ